MIRQSPLTYAGRVRTPSLFVHGAIDERVPAEILQYRDMPHGISGSWNNVHRLLHERAWSDRWLTGAATP